MEYYNVSEFSRRLGVSRTTVVNWEDMGLIKPHHVSPTGRRFYSQQQLEDYFAGKYSKNLLKKES